MKTTFSWQGRRFCFRGAPYGLRHLSQVFQSTMEQILATCSDFVAVYIDDCLVWSADPEQHAKHLSAVLSCLNKWNLRLNVEKCHWGFTRVAVLGHVLTGDTKSVDPDKISTLQQWPVPKTGKQVMALLGFLNFLREYIPLYSTLAAPFEPLRSVKNVAAVWNSDLDAAFARFRAVLGAAPVLEFPRDGLKFIVATDASQFGIAAVLFQEWDQKAHYITFLSKALNGAQLNYSATKRELLAIVFALQRLREYLFGTHFELRTDHKALTYMFTQKHANTMLQNWLDVLLDFSFDVVHHPGITMILPDALSRIYAEVRYAPQVASTNASLRAHSVELVQDVLRVQVEAEKYPDKSLGQFITEYMDKKCPPSEERKALLEVRHRDGLFHAGVLFRALLTDGYYWPGMRSECERLVQTCNECLKYNVGRRGFMPMQAITASYPFEHIAMDLGTFSVTSPRGHNFVLVTACVFTRFVLLRPLRTKEAHEVASVLWQLICDFGTPKIVQSDNGSEFVNAVVASLMALMGVNHRLIAAYSPRANGLAENKVGIVKKVVLKLAGGNVPNFDLYLPAAQRAINLKVAPLNNTVPFALFFCRPSTAFGDFRQVESRPYSVEELQLLHSRVTQVVYPELQSVVAAKNALRLAKHNGAVKDPASLAKERRIPVGSTVMLKDQTRSSKVEPYWIGPYVVREVTRNGLYRVQDERGDLLARKIPRDQVKVIVRARHGAVPAVAEDVFLVDSIDGHRGAEGQREYLIRWSGQSEADRTWEPEGHVQHDLIAKYWRRVSGRDGGAAGSGAKKAAAPGGKKTKSNTACEQNEEQMSARGAKKAPATSSKEAERGAGKAAAPEREGAKRGAERAAAPHGEEMKRRAEEVAAQGREAERGAKKAAVPRNREAEHGTEESAGLSNGNAEREAESAAARGRKNSAVKATGPSDRDAARGPETSAAQERGKIKYGAKTLAAQGDTGAKSGAGKTAENGGLGPGRISGRQRQPSRAALEAMQWD